VEVLTPDGRHRRARVAALRRHHPDRPDLTADDERALRAAALERRIREAISADARPALSLEQRAGLARLLLPAGDAP
jgi:hypothetical protein